jgi:hypothetical protein
MSFFGRFLIGQRIREAVDEFLHLLELEYRFCTVAGTCLTRRLRGRRHLVAKSREREVFLQQDGAANDSSSRQAAELTRFVASEEQRPSRRLGIALEHTVVGSR